MNKDLLQSMAEKYHVSQLKRKEREKVNPKLKQEPVKKEGGCGCD